MYGKTWMDSEPWCDGYTDLTIQYREEPVRIIALLRQQWPWHSMIRLPIESDQGIEDKDFFHLESYDVDVLIILVRTLMSSSFVSEVRHQQSPLMQCVAHDFGWDRRIDYQVKGMLVRKLFPDDDLTDMDALRDKLTLEKLLKHPEVEKVVFGCRLFGLQDKDLIISDKRLEMQREIEDIRTASYEDMTDVNEVKWDGFQSLEECVLAHSYTFDAHADGDTKLARRYSAIPLFIRVAFTPSHDRDHQRSFDDVKRFKLKAPMLVSDGRGTSSTISNKTYILRGITKMDPHDPVENPAEIRVYDFEANIRHPTFQSNNDHRPIRDRKFRPDSGWRVGDPRFKFMLFYKRFDMGDDTPSTSPRSPRGTIGEFRPIRRQRSFNFPPTPKFPPSPNFTALPLDDASGSMAGLSADDGPSYKGEPSQGQRREGGNIFLRQLLSYAAIAFVHHHIDMQEDQGSRASTPGEVELQEVAQRCISSPDKQVFVVGPSRSGKSTRLPVMISALSKRRVICVQPDDWAASYHTEWLKRSEAARAYGGKTLSVGCHQDKKEMPTAFLPEYDVTYVSYRWFYRMVVSVNHHPPTVFNNEYTRAMKAERDEALATKKQMYENLIGAIILDEVHAQSCVQELGYFAVRMATSGAMKAPVGFGARTKVIVTTAYPDNNTFLKFFRLSNEQIAQQTIDIHQGLAPAPRGAIQERYTAGDDPTQGDHHVEAVARAREILKENNNARVLLLMDSTHSARNIARQARFPEEVTLIDLETVAGRDRVTATQRPAVFLATAEFASRIPLEGVTDVICLPSRLIPLQNEDSMKEEMIPNHLDPSYPNPTVHYMFTREIEAGLSPLGGARFRAGDWVALTNQTPMRFPIPADKAEIISRQPDDGWRHFKLSPDHHITLMLELIDRGGLDRRQALFLRALDQIIGNVHVGTRAQAIVTLIGVTLVVFSENPVLRRRGGDKTRGILSTEAYEKHRDVLNLRGRQDYTSDAWTNAVVWMDAKQRAAAANSDVTEAVLREFKFKNALVDKAPLQDAEAKIRDIIAILDVDPGWAEKLYDGSFLLEDKNFNNDPDPRYGIAIGSLWTAYFEAYKFDLVRIAREEGSYVATDVSTGDDVDILWQHLALGLYEQAEWARKTGDADFFAVAPYSVRGRIKSLTMMPREIVYEPLMDHDDRPGAWSLIDYLRLK
ncbi:hypothetical protein F5Y19DRAFT_466209 [Xylariaceae sp. FL1651]|nr:hypothetical protein F5Y19DRAFT_466209 [Xylariaceae sp. FL1651]